LRHLVRPVDAIVCSTWAAAARVQGLVVSTGPVIVDDRALDQRATQMWGPSWRNWGEQLAAPPRSRGDSSVLAQVRRPVLGHVLEETATAPSGVEEPSDERGQ
jgi:hypothetical protein